MMLWKKLQRDNRPVIGHPVLIETTYDENAQNAGQGPADPNQMATQPLSPPDITPQPAAEERSLPRLPFEPQEVSHRLEGPPDWDMMPAAVGQHPSPPTSNHRPSPPISAPSSVTQSPPASRHGLHATTSTFPQSHAEISPPSSPGSDGDKAGLRHGSGRVSPVEPSASHFAATVNRWGAQQAAGPSAASSSADGKRLAAPIDLDLAKAQVERGARMTRWDDFAGDQAGPAAAGPSSTSALYGNGPRPANATFAERILKARQTGKRPEGAKVHEVKRGVAVLQNASDAINRTPPARPPRTESMMGPFGEPSPAGAVYSPGSAAHAALAKSIREDEDIKPTPPLKLGRYSPPRRHSPPPSAHHKVLSNDLGLSTINNIAGVSDTPADADAGHGASSMLTTAAAYQTPPRTPVEHGMGLLSPGYDVGATNPAQSVLDRPRPVRKPRSTDRMSVTRKAVPPRSQQTPRKVTPVSPNKTLPQSPPEAQSVDLITSLQAQLDSLHNRRRNLERIIQELTNLIPTGVGSPSTWELDRRATDCKSELAEVAIQEHDLGIKLHRAWRRKDQEECAGEPTGLWVRRVAG